VILPPSTPQLPLDAGDLCDYPLTVLTGRRYNSVHFETELPLVVPEVDFIEGHYLLRLAEDPAASIYGADESGEIRLVSSEGEVLASVSISIKVTGGLNIAIVAFAAFSVLSLAYAAGYAGVSALSEEGERVRCDPDTDPNCKLA
jgi:hypothetical protein